jgi:putative peptidoglycan lipid II flippase
MSIIFGKDHQAHPDPQTSEPRGDLGPDPDGHPLSSAAGDEDAFVFEDVHIARTAGVVGAATLLSRMLGAVRDIAIASFFGAGMVSDAFFAAFRLPEFLRRMFGEGSLSVAFVPVYTNCLFHRGRQEADLLAASAIRMLALALALATVVGLAAAPWLVQIMAPGFAKSADKFLLTVALARTMLPYVFFIGLVALCMGILNVLGHFAAPALSPACMNVSMIAALATGAFAAGSAAELAMWLAVGVVLGGALQLGLQVPFLIKHQVFFWRRAPLWHPALGRVLYLMGPVMFGAAVFQINSLVITLLGSLLPQGSVSYLYYADRLVQLPLGVFGVAMATAVLPALARQSVAGQHDAMRHIFGHAVKLVFFITLPAMAGLIVLREPIISLLFQRGAFDAQSMRLTADALLYYTMGLWAFSAVRIVLNVFYALQDTRTPVRMATLSIAANLILGVLLMGPMAHRGLALALSLSSTLNFFLLVAALRRRLGALGGRGIAASVVKSALCAAAMGFSVWVLALWLLPPGSGGTAALLPGMAGCMIAGVLIFALLARAMGLAELQSVLQIVRGRMEKR